MMFCKLDLCWILSPTVLTWVSVDFVCGLLIRPISVYMGLIKDTHDYFNNTCILLLHNSNETGIMESEHMLFLQKYLSKNSIPTAVMNFRMFNERVGQNFYHIQRPLFVLMNDALRDDFAHEVASWIAMDYPTWLVFFGNETSITEFFFEIHVPFDCKFMVAQSSPNVIGREIITEVYRVDRGKELRSNQFGVWDVKHGLKGPKHGLYFRRNDLFGQNIRVTSIDDPPLSMLRRNAQNEIIGIDGFFGEVILLLQEAINCTFTYKETKTWGMCLPNGSCSGAVGMLKNNDVDFAAMEFMMTSERLNVIGFTQPVFTPKYRIYIKRSMTTDLKWDAYMAPFSGNIWGAIVFIIVLSSGLIVFIQKLFPFMLPRLQNDCFRFIEIMILNLGAFCAQGMKQSTLDSIRMMQLVIHLLALVIVAAYSASLISHLAVKTFVMPFTTMDGLLQDNTYRFSVIKDSADYNIFQNASDRIMKMMFRQLILKETDLPSNYLDGLESVCKEKKYALMALDNMAIVLQQKINCKLESLDVIMQCPISMALQSNYPYLGIINRNILLLRDSGILQRLMQTQWLRDLNKINNESGWKSVEINDIVPLLFLISITLFVSFLICVMEQVIFKMISDHRIKKGINKPRQQDIIMMLRRYDNFLTQK
ncbi:glutamate receptor-like [Solenopsis invicta]|uniref:glutamate receptor-like n=1 Tax=Solenopsis invicta TaxID=13686 RepID=UPI00193E5170|nr:glutamate receptor-like [Solenopsis invicta]